MRVLRRNYLRVLAHRFEVDAKEVRIMGTESILLRTLVGASSARTADFSCSQFCSEMARSERLGLNPPILNGGPFQMQTQ